MKKYLIFVVIAVAFLTLAEGMVALRAMLEPHAPIDTLLYICDGGKTLGVAYYEGPKASGLESGKPPVPAGSVEVSVDGAASSTLRQTISASGIRYANDDESFVFWSKGDAALIMRNNVMDLDYTNCTAQTAQ